MKLGDTVSGFYYGSKFVGVLAHFDSSAGVTIDCIKTPFIHNGETLDGCYLDRGDRRNAKLTVVEAGPALTPADIVSGQGHTSLKGF